MEEKRSFPGSHDVSELLKKHSHRSFVGDNPRWSPNSATNPHYGGTLIKTGKHFRLDTEPALGLHFHMALTGRMHIPLAWLIGGLIGAQWD